MNERAKTTRLMRLVRCLILIVVLGLALSARAEDDQPLPKNWVYSGDVALLSISPDGKRVAGIRSRLSTEAFVIDLDTSRTTIVAKYRPDQRYLFGSQVGGVHWISNDLLAVDYTTLESFSVDLTGKQIAKLGERYIRRLYEKGESSDWVLAYRDLKDREIDAVNARSGERRKFSISLPGKLRNWAFDATGVLRAVTMMDTAYWAEKTTVSNWYRADEQSPWQLLEEVPVTHDHFIPMRALPELNMLAVLSRHGRDTYAVFRYDTVNRRHVEVMAGHPTEDILGVAGLDEENLEAVFSAGIKPRVSWFDPRWAGLQAAVDTALPGRINYLLGDKNGRVLVTSYSDVDPGRWYLLDTKTSKMREVAEARPGVDPKRALPMETIQYTARRVDDSCLPDPARTRHEYPRTDGGADPWWPEHSRPLGMERRSSIARGPGLRRLPAAVPRIERLWAAIRGGGPSAMGPCDAGRHHRRCTASHRAKGRQPGADLHLRRQLRRLCGTVGRHQDTTTLQVRRQPGRCERPQRNADQQHLRRLDRAIARIEPRARRRSRAVARVAGRGLPS